MADLLYHIRNFFTLIDGYGNSINIREPINWDKIFINIDFKNANNTYSVEFTDKDVQFQFDERSGKKFIQDAYKKDGVDTVIIMQFGQMNPNDSVEVLYTGQANFSNFDKESLSGSPILSFNMERRSLNDNFMNRYSTKTNLNLAKSLSGNIVPAAPQVSVRLHTKALTANANYKYDPHSDTSFPTLSVITDDNNVGTGDYYKTLSPPIIFNGDSNIDGLQEPLEPDGQLIYAGSSLPPGVIRRILSFNFIFTVQWFILEPAIDNIFFGAKIYKKSNISGGGTASISNGTLTQEIDSDEFAWTGIGVPINTLQLTGKINLYADEAIFIRLYFRRHGAPLAPTIDPTIKFLGLDTPIFTVKEELKFSPTLVNGFSVLDAIKKQVALITDSPNVIVKSNYFTRGVGCMGNRILLGGKMLRGFSDFDSGAVMSAQDWYQGLNGLSPIGMNFENDPTDGSEYLRIENIDYFFRNVQLLELTSIDLKSYKKSVDSSFVYNEINAGASKAPQSGQDDSINDWMGSYVYSTPILRMKNALPILTQFVLDSFYIELARRQQASVDASVTYETDSNIFLLHDTNVLRDHFVNSNGAIFRASLKEVFFVNDIDTGICLNDVISLSGTGLVNNKSYTVAGVDEDSDGTAVPLDGIGTHVYVREVIVDETYNAPIRCDYSPRYDCKKDEDFNSVVGINSPSTAYNLIHHTIRIVMAWAKIWRSGMNQKSEDKTVVFTTGAANSNLGTSLKSSVSCRMGDNQPDGTIVYDGGNGNALPLKYLDDPLFTEFTINFKCKLTWEIVKLIQKAYRGIHPDDLNYGYISLTNPEGVIETGWIIAMKFQPVELTVEFTLRERYTNG